MRFIVRREVDFNGKAAEIDVFRRRNTLELASCRQIPVVAGTLLWQRSMPSSSLGSRRHSHVRRSRGGVGASVARDARYLHPPMTSEPRLPRRCPGTRRSRPTRRPCRAPHGQGERTNGRSRERTPGSKGTARRRASRSCLRRSSQPHGCRRWRGRRRRGDSSCSSQRLDPEAGLATNGQRPVRHQLALMNLSRSWHELHPSDWLPTGIAP